MDKLIKKLKKHNDASTMYLNEFYEECKDGIYDELEWIETEKDFENFINNCPQEYNRIYDLAVKHITEDLLKYLTTKNK